MTFARIGGTRFSPLQAAALGQGSTTAHLLSIYDEFMSGYKDRSAIVSRQGAATLSAMDNALSHIMVVDGHIVGTWKARIAGDVVVVAASPFGRLCKREDRAIITAAAMYAAFLCKTARVELGSPRSAAQQSVAADGTPRRR